MNTLFDAIAEQISQTQNSIFTIRSYQAIAGGDINQAFCVLGQNQRYFVKINRADLLNMFTAEAQALQALANTNTVRVPAVICYGHAEHRAFLVLEYLPFARSSSSTARLLGEQLARLHQQPQAYFGWVCDNTIGSTPQINTPNDNWLDFWREQRLGWQLQLAQQTGYHGRLQTLGEQLLERMPALFTDYQPQAALLHGDLWGGNTGALSDGQAVLFDPASYFGDREADIAMTELFGGFSADFYAAYNAVWALDSGYKVRQAFYNLYHILNHLNLFGGGYLAQAERTIASLLAELR